VPEINSGRRRRTRQRQSVHGSATFAGLGDSGNCAPRAVATKFGTGAIKVTLGVLRQAPHDDERFLVRSRPCTPRNAIPPVLHLAVQIAYSFGMRCVLGFDGGGTKTDCVLMDESRQILARTRSGPSNPTRVGLEVTFAALLEAAEKALAASGISAGEVATIYGGIAGLGAARVAGDLVRMLKPKFSNAVVLLKDDLSMALLATEEIPSVVVIAGTGSAVLGRNSPDKFAREGGWGPILGDPGSAYDIGRKAIVLSLRHWLRGQNSPLGNEILHRFHRNWIELQDQIRANADSVFPEVFPIVAKAADERDEAARVVLQSAAEELAEMAARVIETLGLRDQSFFLAKTGGVFGRSQAFDDRFDSLVAQVAPHARIGALPMPIAEFAARAAVNCLDSPVRNVGG
jgi:N-acetylglucosamine kinase-like BadF-type ATPase